MGNFRFISEEQKKLILSMSLRGLTDKEISSATGVSTRTIVRIRGIWKSTGRTVKLSLERGRPRALTSLEISYLESFVKRRPDIYVSELQHALVVAYNIDVDVTTITRALHRRGYTRKSITRPARKRDEEPMAQEQADIGENYHHLHNTK